MSPALGAVGAVPAGMVAGGLPRAWPGGLPGGPGWNPVGVVGDVAANAADKVALKFLAGAWDAGLQVLQLAFRGIDRLTTPDVSATGPLSGILPITLWIGGTLAVIMFLVQVGLALIRRDGQSIGRILLGTMQLGLVWAVFLGVAAATVTAAGALEHGILSAALGVDSLSSVDFTKGWARDVTDVSAAIVLAITSLLVLIPASLTDLLVALVRDAALILLVATAPISAAGLVSDVGRAWCWKTLRWFIAAVSISPLSALVLGVGTRVSARVVQGAGDDTWAAVGTAVVGALLVAVAAIAPLTLFRLLAFIEPSTVSGAAMRQAWADLGGLGSRGAPAVSSAGSTVAASGDGAGRSQGEATAATANQSRLQGALGVLGQAWGAAYRGSQLATGVAFRGVDLGTDVLGAAGVGHAGYSMTPADERALRASRRHDAQPAPAAPAPAAAGGGDGGGGNGGGGGGGSPGGGAPGGASPAGPAGTGAAAGVGGMADVSSVAAAAV